MTSLFVILNPAACGGRTAGLADRLEAALEERNLPYRLERSDGPGHPAELAHEAVRAGAERLLVVGGDGTIHDVANGLLSGNDGHVLPPMAILPVGTGNDFHRMVGTKKGISRALDLVSHGRSVFFDVGVARWEGEERYFVNLLGVGVDVEVLRQRKAFGRLPGLLQYMAALVWAVARFQAPRLRVELEGTDGGRDETIEARSLLSAVTVGPSVGGGFFLCPGAEPRDGFLDLCFVEPMGLGKIARNLPRVLRGTHGEAEEVRLHRFRSGRVSMADGSRFTFEMDGEVVRPEASVVEFRIEPERLPVLVPGRGAGEGTGGRR